MCTHENPTHIRESETPHTWEVKKQKAKNEYVQHSQLRITLGPPTERKVTAGWKEEQMFSK